MLGFRATEKNWDSVCKKNVMVLHGAQTEILTDPTTLNFLFDWYQKQTNSRKHSELVLADGTGSGSLSWVPA